MRYYIIFYFFLTITAPLSAQNARELKFLKTEADRFYEEEQYHLAIQYYRELADFQGADPAVAYSLAECYRKTFNYPEAEAYYLKVHFQAPEQYPLSLYYYALMLKFNANFDESIAYFDEFISSSGKSNKLEEFFEQAIIDRAGCETAREELAAGNTTEILPLALNTEFNDYAPAVLDSNTVVITSGRITSNRQAIDERFGEAFTDNYYFQKQGNIWVDKTRQLFGITNTRYNDGSGCFNSKRDKYYFSVCGMDGPQCKLFVTSFKDSRWGEPQELNSNVNYKSYEARHPAISQGGDTLIFASNRQGGFGGFDLWMSINSGNEEWGPPINLGSGVNTKLNELTPTLTTFPNVLFFASDGHEGYGALDLYMAKQLSTGETVIYNLGSPFNSNRDDCFVSFAEHTIFWSSNRADGRGGFDIISAKIPSVISFISKLSLKKRNASRNIKLKSKIDEAKQINLAASRLEERIEYEQLTYEKKLIVDEIIRNRMNNVATQFSQFSISSSEFELLNRIAEREYEQRKIRERGFLTKLASPAAVQEDLSITGDLIDALDGSPLKDKLIALTDTLGEVLKKTKTNQDGKFRFTDVPRSADLLLRLEDPTDTARTPTIENLVMDESKSQQVIHFENIYFDFDHYSLRPESRNVLNELAEHVKQNPGVQVEIFAFADDRGTSRYNLELTQKRGQAVADYLVGRGLDQTGLAIVAKGRQAPKEVDVELQRQYNRRVEFYLNGYSKKFEETARTYILRKKSDWESLAKALRMSPGALRELNGAVGDVVKAFQPVRVPLDVSVGETNLFFVAF